MMEGKFFPERHEPAEKKKYAYTYCDNSDANKPVVFEVIADDILQADREYEEKTGKDLKNQPHVGCSIKGVAAE